MNACKPDPFTQTLLDDLLKGTTSERHDHAVKTLCGEEASYPDAEPSRFGSNADFAFNRQGSG